MFYRAQGDFFASSITNNDTITNQNLTIMKTPVHTQKQVKTNKVLGLYTIFMVSLSISYIVTTFLQLGK
ncbi:hypothetical protein MED134_05194 [Dokdonia sp. MED134]|nr:hypothetical protein MED134_05194 [Dokdonia sp. MED134]